MASLFRAIFMSYNDTPSTKEFVMHLKFTHYANIALSAALLYDMVIARRNKAKYKEIIETHDGLCDLLTLSHRQLDYLLRLINENGIDIDEFDKIALDNLNMAAIPRESE